MGSGNPKIFGLQYKQPCIDHHLEIYQVYETEDYVSVFGSTNTCRVNAWVLGKVLAKGNLHYYSKASMHALKNPYED